MRIVHGDIQYKKGVHGSREIISSFFIAIQLYAPEIID